MLKPFCDCCQNEITTDRKWVIRIPKHIVDGYIKEISPYAYIDKDGNQSSADVVSEVPS